MALMFPRLARNFAKNGYYPTDEPTLERALNALMPSDGPMCILDPCAGEGVAIAEASHALGREQAKAFAVEFDAERARHARGLVDHCLHADLMDTMISKQSFGLLWLNPPYGDLSKDVNGNIGYQGQGRARLEKLFYQRSLSLLQYSGVLVFIVPASPAEPEHFFRVTMEPEQFADEVGRLQGLWPSLDTHLGTAQQSLRPPARALSHWHLALALAAGAISGVVRSQTGRVLVVKGDTHKDKTLQREFTEREDGSIAETRILTDKFVPVIRAWDMTPGSPTRGEVLTIR